MKLKLTLAVFSLLLSLNIRAQNWQWAVGEFVGFSTDLLVASHDGHILVSKRMATGPARYKVRLYTNDGLLVDSTGINGKIIISQIKPDAMGNWFLSGSFEDSVNFTNGTAYYYDGHTPNNFICKLNAATLEVEWTQAIGGEGWGDMAFAINSEGIYVALDSFDNYDATHFIRYDPITFSRTNLFSCLTGYTKEIAVDDLGNIYHEGIYANGLLHFNGIQDSLSEIHTCITRFKKDGTHDWHFFIGDKPVDFNLVSNNLFYLLGPLGDSFSVGSFFHPAHSSKYLILRMDSLENVVWLKESPDTSFPGGNLAFNILRYSATQDSNLYFVSRVLKGFIWDDSTVQTMAPYYNLSLVGVNPQAKIICVEKVSGLQVQPNSIAADHYGVYVTGDGDDSSMLHCGTISIPASLTTETYFLAKLDTLSLGLTFNSPDNGLHIYPNPAHDNIRVEMDSPASIILTDIFGRVVLASSIANQKRLDLNVSELPRGIYVLAVVKDNKKITRKVFLL